MARSFDRDEARRLGRLGGIAKAAKARALREPQPFTGTFLDAMDAAGLTGESWEAWRTLWKAVDGLNLTPTELEVFRRHTGRTTATNHPAREVFLICGRRAGKSRNAALRAVWTATSRDYTKLLAPGERATVSCLAADRSQARILVRYVAGLCKLPAFAPCVRRTLRDSVEFSTGCAIEIHTTSWRTTRGYSLAGVIADELAFWRSDESGANPDSEILDALRPGLATIPGALLLGCSTPYAPSGELFRAWERHYSRNDSDVLVWVAPSRAMNPALDPRVIERAYASDPEAAASEYGAEWRRDVAALFDPVVIRSVVIPGRFELPPAARVAYAAFADPAGGSGGDSFTVAIAHHQEGRAVLDLVREIRPPFSPSAAVEELAQSLGAYGITTVTGDRYAGEWPREAFRRAGITYEPTQRTKSDYYRELLPLVNGSKVELLDLPKLTAQLVGLERRVARGTGRDSIDHGPGRHDDIANAAAGALVLASEGGSGGGLVYLGGRVVNLHSGQVVEGDPVEGW